MEHQQRWDPCVAHRGEEVDEFMKCYFGESDRRVLFVGGASFDPRSCIVAARLGSLTKLRGLIVREERSPAGGWQADMAEANARTLARALTDYQMEPVKVFGQDNAVIGGRGLVASVKGMGLDEVTDVVVDVSGLSAGMSFPVVRYLAERIHYEGNGVNLHVFVVHDPGLDSAIQPIACDAPGWVHGFKGRSTLYDAAGAARLWLPQLATKRRAALERLYHFVNPDDTCPILPFPASDPRIGDALAGEYLMNELEVPWSVDAGGIVYADEGDPLDLYRTILKLDDLRRPVFAETGGSTVVLSPLGSKVMALGALMAALERDLPVAYLESIGYAVDQNRLSKVVDPPNLLHVWLEGDVYPQPRPALLT